MSLSTGRGDDGNTGIRDGRRLPKDHPRIECLGVLDELSAFLGEARLVAEKRTGEILLAVQEDLRALMGILAAEAAPAAGTHPKPGTGAVPDPARLGAWIREFEAGTSFRDFVIPGENSASAKLHIARTVCRRAERRLVTLARSEQVPALLLQYLNRLSDLLFLLAGSGS
jgi:cob(I)alamin adenosyltransferase